MKPRLAAPLLLLALPACRDLQSALDPRGLEAERVATLSWVLFAGAAVIFVGVMALALLAIGNGRARRWLASERAILWGGVVFPFVVLVAVLAYGLATMRAGATAASPASLRIQVNGELWWWRVTVRDGQGRTFETANELHLPVGETVAVELTSTNVIHSLWIPSLAGKLDMIPGRTNVLHLSPQTAAVMRGQCAEFCGGAHALMSLYVVAQPRAEFDAWMQRQAQPAAPPPQDDAAAREGAQLFLEYGCGGCHSVRGTAAAGRTGPDLTHVASRLSIAAATLPTNRASFVRWLARSHEIKPENLMPPYEILTGEQLERLAAYLSTLR